MNWFADSDGGWFATWFGVQDDTDIPGALPDGAATFALALENGYTVTYRWPTALKKMRSGKEQRDSRLDASKESYDGSVLLFGDQAVAARASLARYAAAGDTFLLGLPHEGLSMRLASSGTTVYVHSTAERDWMNPGQRVICMWIDSDDPTNIEASEGVIQSTTSTTIVLDEAPGDAGQLGGIIMPSRAIYLEPEQSMPRYQTAAERWDLRARAATLDFAPAPGVINLESVLLSAPAGAVLTCRVASLIPRYLDLYISNSWPATGLLSEVPPILTFKAKPGVTTLGDFATALASSTLFTLTGDYDPAATFGAFDEALYESTVSDVGDVGTGASVTTYADHPVWDQPLENDSTITDSIHALTSIIDHDGVPYAVGMADMADWGRSIVYTGELGADFQWLKLFLATTKGPQKAFWLSTQREDLPVVSSAGADITVEGDVAAWWPAQREHLHVVEADGTSTYCEITDGVDNGDGTWTLTTDATFVDPVTASWLELCRFTGEDFPVTFDEHGFTFNTTATAVQQ